MVMKLGTLVKTVSLKWQTGGPMLTSTYFTEAIYDNPYFLLEGILSVELYVISIIFA